MALQSLTLGSLRRSIGKNLGIVIDGVVTTTGDTTSLIDTANLLGGDDEHNEKQVRIYDSAGGTIVDGETQAVTDFDNTPAGTCDATVSAFTAAITALDKYEMWKVPWRIADIDDAINQAINEITSRAFLIKDNATLFSEASKYLYTIPTGFTHLYKVEYVYSETAVNVDACEAAWTGNTGTTTTADATFEKEGTYCSKNVVVGVGVTTILCYEDISSINLTGCDKVEFWMYSSIALTAGQLQIRLSSTAAIASAEETIDIPAMTAATWYRHSLSLEAPHSDSAIISVGIYQVANVADFTFYVDDVKAVLSTSREYKPLPIEYWDIARGSTNYLQITDDGVDLMGDTKLMRLEGFQIIDRMTADTDTCDVDPAYIIAKTTGRLLISHAKSRYLDIHDRASLSQYWLGEAARMERGLSTVFPGTIKKV